jgi:hypothetical protein
MVGIKIVHSGIGFNIVMPKMAIFFKLRKLIGMNRQLRRALTPFLPVQLTLFDFPLKFYSIERMFLIPVDAFIG